MAKASGLATPSLPRALLIETNKKWTKPLMVPESWQVIKDMDNMGQEKKVVKDANLNLGPH